jgi:hypothetical protein
MIALSPWLFPISLFGIVLIALSFVHRRADRRAWQHYYDLMEYKLRQTNLPLMIATSEKAGKSLYEVMTSVAKGDWSVLQAEPRNSVDFQSGSDHYLKGSFWRVLEKDYTVKWRARYSAIYDHFFGDSST